jgi:nitrite reductase/ring-hydroxylating ferredoxin subunit
MNMRGITRYVEDLIRSRRPRRFTASEEGTRLARIAITLRAARPGSGAPREEFVQALHKRLAASLDSPPPGTPASQAPPGRRAFLRAATVTGGVAVVGGAAVAGAAAEHALTASPATGTAPQPELIPDHGTWLTVANSAELTEGTVQEFTAGVVTWFVSRSAGQLLAVQGICTHQGCKLILDVPSAAATAPSTVSLLCPCHGATFATDGAVRSHRLRFPLADLPTFDVREAHGTVQVYAPLAEA